SGSSASTCSPAFTLRRGWRTTAPSTATPPLAITPWKRARLTSGKRRLKKRSSRSPSSSEPTEAVRRAGADMIMAETDETGEAARPQVQQPGLKFLEAAVYIMGGLLVLMLLGLL